uniref:Uncharacterized protein n=1 Tax=Plectus sambesii TaxID=2011161 RepID=A0A914VK90_9BILA
GKSNFNAVILSDADNSRIAAKVSRLSVRIAGVASAKNIGIYHSIFWQHSLEL